MRIFFMFLVFWSTIINLKASEILDDLSVDRDILRNLCLIQYGWAPEGEILPNQPL